MKSSNVSIRINFAEFRIISFDTCDEMKRYKKTYVNANDIIMDDYDVDSYFILEIYDILTKSFYALKVCSLSHYEVFVEALGAEIVILAGDRMIALWKYKEGTEVKKKITESIISQILINKSREKIILILESGIEAYNYMLEKVQAKAFDAVNYKRISMTDKQIAVVDQYDKMNIVEL